MGNKIYTIGREFGSAGYEVGRLLADRLQIGRASCRERV